MKRILCVFLALLLTATIVQPTSSFVYADDTAYSQSDSILDALGVDVRVANPETVTRSEFLYILMQILKAPSSDNSELPYSDISPFDYYYPVVRYALDLGIISSADKFYPYSPVKFQDACKMMISALGMDFVAKNNGGYPTGFMVAAQKCDLTEGIDSTDYLSLDAAIALFSNFLETEAYSVIAIEGNSPSYEVLDSSRDVLSLYHNIVKITGVVTANQYTGLYDADSCSDESRVKIGDITFKTEIDTADFIGKKADAYVKNEDTVIFIKATDNKELTVKISDIVSVSKGRIVYAEDIREKYISIEAVPAVIYNGKADKNFKLSNLKSLSGYATFTDNNEDGRYDVISISVYRLLYVENVDSYGKCIFGKDNSILRFDNNSYYYLFEKSGIKATSSDIAPGNLLQIYESANKDLVRIEIVADTKFTGTVEELDTANNKLYIDGIAYEYGKYFNDNYLANVAIGQTATFVLTADGILAVAEKGDVTNELWGYVIAAKESTGLDTAYTFKIFASTGSVEVYEIADKITYDGNSKNASDFYSYYTSNSALFSGLISFKLNAKGEINFVDTPDRTGTISDNLPIEDKTTEFIAPAVGSALWYITGTKMFLGTCGIKDAKIFVISPDEALDDEERFALVDTSYFVTNTSYTPSDVKIYNVNDCGEAQAVFISSAISSDINPETSPYALVNSVTRWRDADGTEGISLRLFYKNQYTKYFISDISVLKQIDASATFEDPKIVPGDVLAYNARTDNHILAVRKAFNYTAKTTDLGFGNLIQDNRVYGKAYSKNNSMISILVENKEGFTPSPDDPSKRFYFPMPASVMVYDSAASSCYMGSASEIVTYLNDPVRCSNVLLIANDGYALELIVFK